MMVVILFENQIQTTSTSPCRTQVQPAASFLVCSLIFIEYYFKNDDRFFLLYHNIGNWGQGDRSKDDCVTVFKNDMSFGISKKAVDLGYHLSLPSIVVHNSFSCYANRLNHYMFNVRGIVQACTVALYDNQNVFGNINTGLINKDKMKGWFLSVIEDCKTCPFVLVCKSGFCPMDKHITKLSSSVICKNMQEKIRKNLAVYAIFGCYEDILDVD